jgi:hypothetical protein
MRQSSIRWLSLLLLLIIQLVHKSLCHLNKNHFVNARYHCTSSSEEYSIEYYMNNFIEKGQVTIRSNTMIMTMMIVTVTLNNDDNIIVMFNNNNSNIWIQYNTSLVVNNSDTIQTDKYTMSAHTTYHKDDYYLKKMKYYILDFSNVANNISFYSVTMNNMTTNTTILTSEKELCKDYSFRNTMYYHYFQNAYSISTVIISALFVLMGFIIFTLQIVLGNSKLMKSRLLSEIPCGLSLGASDLMLLIGYGIDLYWMYNKSVRNLTLLVMLSYIRAWFVCIGCISYVLNCIRYIYMINFYKLMKSGNTITKFQRFIASKTLFLIVLIILGIVVLIVFIIVGVIIGPVDLSGSFVGSIVTLLFCLVAVVCGVIVIVLEMIINLPTIRKHGILSYYRRDPLYLRLQMTTVIFSVAAGIVYGAINSILDANYSSITLTYVRIGIYCLSYLFFGLALRVMMMGAFSCGIQLWQIATHKKNNLSESESELVIDKLLQDPECYDLMVDYW